MLAEDTQSINGAATAGAQRASGLRFADPRARQLLQALILFRQIADDLRCDDLRRHLAALSGRAPDQISQGAMSYQLRRLRLRLRRTPAQKLPLPRHRLRPRPRAPPAIQGNEVRLQLGQPPLFKLFWQILECILRVRTPIEISVASSAERHGLRSNAHFSSSFVTLSAESPAAAAFSKRTLFRLGVQPWSRPKLANVGLYQEASPGPSFRELSIRVLAGPDGHAFARCAISKIKYRLSTFGCVTISYKRGPV